MKFSHISDEYEASIFRVVISYDVVFIAAAVRISNLAKAIRILEVKMIRTQEVNDDISQRN